ncbi:MAG: YihY/virulence factor BrkB family protein [Acetobacteraceae bacterium]
MADDRSPTATLLTIVTTLALVAALFGRSAPKPVAAAAPREAGAGAGLRPARPSRGWWTVLKCAFNRFNDDRVMTEAAGVTFYTLLALFPAIATLISIYGLFADPGNVSAQLQSITGVVPSGGMDIIEAQVRALAANGQQTLSYGVVIGVATSLWSANQGIKGLFDALNVVYHEKEKRGYFVRTVLSMCFTLGGILFLVVAMSAIVVVPIVLSFVGFADETAVLLQVARWPVLMAALVLFLSAVYRFGPSRSGARWQWVSWGSVFAAVVWVLASIGFSDYVANFGSYNKTYGSLGAVIGFMTWIWISAIIVLIGAELNAELEEPSSPDAAAW